MTDSVAAFADTLVSNDEGELIWTVDVGAGGTVRISSGNPDLARLDQEELAELARGWVRTAEDAQESSDERS